MKKNIEGIKRTLTIDSSFDSKITSPKSMNSDKLSDYYAENLSRGISGNLIIQITAAQVLLLLFYFMNRLYLNQQSMLNMKYQLKDHTNTRMNYNMKNGK